jgi:hypothetical protein
MSNKVGHRSNSKAHSSRRLTGQQSSETPSSTRIRDNQRRSRSRRVELIRDLQNRVQEYERNGVTATQEMQRAARKVANDNVRLRALLARNGVSQEVVDSYLRSFDNVENSGDAWVATVEPSPPCEVRTPEMVSGPALCLTHSSDHAQHSVPHHDRHNILLQVQENPPALPTTRQMRLSPSTAREHIDNLQDNSYPHDTSQTSYDIEGEECPNSPSCFCTPVSTAIDQPTSFGLEISCETAATIIAEMRGDGDRESVRASLGCNGRTECSIKNTTVLQVMDER